MNKKNKSDFSKTTIAVLLVLAIFVSVLNTIILLNNFSSNLNMQTHNLQEQKSNINQNGAVKLHIVGSDNANKIQENTQASLKLNIIKK